MPRYPHIIAPASGGRWPSRVLIVDTTATGSRDGVEGNTVTDSLSRWYVRGLKLAGQSYLPSYSKNGFSVADFWSDLHSVQAQSGSTWLLSYQCGRVWSLLGLWERIERRDIRIVGQDMRDYVDETQETKTLRLEQKDILAPISSGARNRRRASREGTFVVAEPPCILTAKLANAQTRFTWVDSRNYAVSPTDDVASGTPTLDYLQEWFLSYRVAMRTLSMGSLQTTIGGQAMHGWKVGYYVGGIYSGGQAENSGIACASYYGGRCEAFQLGRMQSGGWHHDASSAYAFHATSCRVPQWLDHCLHNPGVETLRQCCSEYTCCAEVAIETDEPAYPCRRSLDGTSAASGGGALDKSHGASGGRDLIFPVGRFHTVLMGPELEDALSLGRVKMVKRVECYHGAPVLADFARAVYQMRVAAEMEGNVALAKSAKAMAVAFVGKWGQRERKWVHLPDVWTDVLYGEWYGSGPIGVPHRFRSLSGVVQREDIGGLSADAVPSIAAWITASARTHLLGWIRLCGWDHVYYVDTDSIITDDSGHDALLAAGSIQSQGLGVLQTRALYDDLEIRGIKYYVADGEVVCSGLPRGRCEDAGDAEHYWYQSHPAEYVRLGARPEARRTLHSYTRTTDYRHGVRQPGGRVLPIELKEW